MSSPVTSSPLKRASAISLIALLVVLIVAACARLMVGETAGWPDGNFFAAISRIFAGDWQEPSLITLMHIRLMRVVLAILAGIALATSGVALQNLLRNPLAEPFILGLSSGAAVGFVAQGMLSRMAQTTLGPGYTGATIGALVVMGLVFVGGRKRGVVDPLGMLLVGVIVSTLCNAIIMIFWQIAPQGEMTDAARWMMGALDEGLDSLEIIIATLLIFTCFTWLWLRHSAMDVALLTDGEAMSLGVNLTAHRSLMFLTGALLAAAAVVLAGPLAFIGLVCPHVARLMFGQRHRLMLPAAAVLGAVLVLGADIAVATIRTAKVQRFPIGVFTALIGGPVFLSMLRKQLGRGGE